MNGMSYERLSTFMQAYFHEDWDADDPDARIIVHEFIHDTRTSAELEMVADELSLLLAEARDSHELERYVLHELGCYYDPSADGVSLRTWLESVEDTLRSAANQRAQDEI